MTAPLSRLAGGIAAARAEIEEFGVLRANLAPGMLDAIRAADKWRDSRPVASDLVVFGRRVMEAAGLDDGDRTPADDPVIERANLAITHARELVEVAFVTGYNFGHDAGHKTGRKGAAIDSQVSHLSQAERRAASAAATRDAAIRSEFAELLGLRADASWTLILEALDTMKRAAKLVAHMFAAVGGDR